MKFTSSTIGSARLRNLPKSILVFFCFLGAFTRLPAAAKWDPIDPAEWAQTKSKIDPEADAEVILDETEVDGESAYSSYVTHHVRVRIYGQRAVEKYSKVDIVFEKNLTIRKLEARTVTPDGQVSLLDPKDIYEREVLRSGNVRKKVKSFAPPGLVPNCILEYRFVEDNNYGITHWIMVFRRDIPARLVHYKIKMDGYIAGSLACVSFSCPNPELKEDKHGYYNFEMRDLPAQKEEAFSAPPINSQPVVVLYLSERSPGTPQEYWKKRAVQAHEVLNDEAGSSRAARATLATLVAPTDDLETKLHKIYDYCCTKIVNRHRDNVSLTSEQKKKLKDNENASDTLKQGNGTPYDINLAFASLARAAGADVRLALCNDRSVMLYSSKIGAPFLLPDVVVAIKAGDRWRFFDPGSSYLPFGQLNWSNCDTNALLSGPKEGELVATEGPPAEFSIRNRSGRFTLDTDGVLEGDVTVTYSGLYADEVRDEIDSLTPEEQAKDLRERLQATLKLAEVTNVVFENTTDFRSDLKVSYHLRVPEYAERTGSRLFVQPAVFQKNLQPVFDSPTRSGMVLLHYRNTEIDEITIQPPAGYALEAASSPGKFGLGNFATYAADIGVYKKSGKIKYTRKFTVNALAVPLESYPALKTAYDQIHAKDNHVLGLKQSAPAPASPGDAAAPAPAPTDKSTPPPATAPATASTAAEPSAASKAGTNP